MKTHLLKHLLLVALLNLTALSLRAQSERELIVILQSNAGAVEKCEACKKLRLVGTAHSVPALAALLSDERVSQAARYALEAMPAPEAGAALRAALDKTTGLLKAGVVDSLGWRRDAEAVPQLKRLLTESDTTVAAAAASALGKIGGKQAVAALESARAKSLPVARPAVLEGLMRCAEELLAEGKTAKARAIYKSLFAKSEADYVRVAAYAGLIRSADGRSFALIKSALEGNDPAAKIAALQFAGSSQNPDATKTFVELLRKSPPPLKIALLALLQTRGDVTALPAVLSAARSPDLAVRVAAVTTLGELGDATAIPLLAEASTSGEAAEQAAARQALVLLHHGDIAAELVAELGTAPPTVQLELVRALSARSEKSAVPELLRLARGDRPPTRKAALQALANLTDGSHLTALMQLLTEAKDVVQRDEVRGVFESLAGRNGDQPQLDFDPIVRGLADSDFATRQALLQISALFVDELLRAALSAALKDSDERIGGSAARALCDTRDTALLPDILELARQTTDIGLRSLALEGAVRLTTDDGARLSPQQRADTLAVVFELATRLPDRRMALSGLARVPHRKTLALAEQACTDADVKAEAEIACLQIAQELGSAELETAEAALAQLASSAGSLSLQTNAQVLLRKLNSGWLFAGPYRQAGKQAPELFDIPFEPEQHGVEVKWQRAPGAMNSSRPGEVDMSGIVGGDHCVVYLKTRLYVPVAQKVRLLIGSHDGIKLWLNGEVAHANNVVRSLQVDDDKATVRLHQGWNDLLAKVTQHSAGCGITFRATQEDGQDVPGLRLDPRGGLTRPNTGFKRSQLSDEFYAEGAYYGDFNRDGKLDVVGGPFWFEEPAFTQRHEYRPAKTFNPREYSDNFLTYAGDCNGDGWTDIVCVPFPGKEGYWYENPRGKDGHWKQHLYYPMVGNESPAWGDVTGDGRPELIFCNEGYLGYAGPDLKQPEQPWVFHTISGQDKRYQRFTHGVGVGDLNGDGRVDIVEAAGWWEQTAAAKPDQSWKFHPFQFAHWGAQMLIYDVDGDGLADIVSSWNCHEYGLVWWQQVRKDGDAPDWKQHVILPPKPELASPDLRVSQLHALDLVDMNGDGLKDIVTGKRFWAHGPAGDPEPNAPAVVYWFELRRDPGGNASFTPHLIDGDSGVGTQVTTADLNGDGRPDVIVGNKKGIFIHLSQPAGQAAGSSGHKEP